MRARIPGANQGQSQAAMMRQVQKMQEQVLQKTEVLREVRKELPEHLQRKNLQKQRSRVRQLPVRKPQAAALRKFPPSASYGAFPSWAVLPLFSLYEASALSVSFPFLEKIFGPIPIEYSLQ